MVIFTQQCPDPYRASETPRNRRKRNWLEGTERQSGYPQLWKRHRRELSSPTNHSLTASGGTGTITSDPTNSSEFAVSGITLPYQLKAGDSVQATVTFTPNASGTASATAGFISNAKDSPTSTALNGTGLTQSSYSADLSWEAGTEDIVGYNLYRGTTHGGPYSAINSALLAQTTYTDSTVASGNTYYYVATEVNNQGQESGLFDRNKGCSPVTSSRA